MKIIDAHCHIFPDKIARFATRNIQMFYDLPHASFRGEVNELAEQCNKSGVDKCVVSMVATAPSQPQKFNNAIAELIENFGDKFIPLGTLHPQSETIQADFEHIISLGFKGVKLHPDMQENKADCDGYKAIYELCSQKGLPVLLHTGDSRYDNSNPDRIAGILQEFPELTIIGAHFGGWSVWEEAAEKLYKYDNFFVDTCSSMVSLTDTVIRKFINKYGTDKVIFGTDYPIWKQEDEIRRIMSLGFSQDEYEKIFHKNVEMVLNIC